MKIQDRQITEEKKQFAHLDLHSTFFQMQLFVSFVDFEGGQLLDTIFDALTFCRKENISFFSKSAPFLSSSVVAREWGNLDGIELICWSPPGEKHHRKTYNSLFTCIGQKSASDKYHVCHFRSDPQKLCKDLLYPVRTHYVNDPSWPLSLVSGIKKKWSCYWHDLTKLKI